MGHALCIGIDHYDKPGNNLKCCINDATTMAETLKRNDDFSINLHVKTLLSDPAEGKKINSDLLKKEIRELFARDSDVVVLFFSGHGKIDKLGNGFLVSQTGTTENPGLSMGDIVTALKQRRAREVFIIIDCCHSGFFGKEAGAAEGQASQIPERVSILTASTAEELAWEGNNGLSLFTNSLIQGLKGGAADITGEVTSSALFNYVNKMFSPWGQQPMYKANIKELYPLRKCTPKVPLEVLFRLTQFFPTADSPYSLSPQHEPDINRIDPELQPDPELNKQFSMLQKLTQSGLVRPDMPNEHMYFAAINSGSCSLTEQGKLYWHMVKQDKI